MAACGVAHAEEAKDVGWRFVVAPYLWAAGINGETGAQGQTADIDWSFSDILENLDMAFMVQFEVHKGAFGFVVSPVYMDLVHAFNERRSTNLRGDVGGGAGQSDFVWNALAAVGYKLGGGNTYLGYRVLDYDYQDGNVADRLTFDIRIDGPVLGDALTF
jgi:hypothetical protein